MWETVHIKDGTLWKKLNELLEPKAQGSCPQSPPAAAYVSPLLLSAYLGFYVPLDDYFFHVHLLTEL